MSKEQKTTVRVKKKLGAKFDEMACASGFGSREEAILFLIEHAVEGGVLAFWREPIKGEQSWHSMPIGGTS